MDQQSWSADDLGLQAPDAQNDFVKNFLVEHGKRLHASFLKISNQRSKHLVDVRSAYIDKIRELIGQNKSNALLELLIK